VTLMAKRKLFSSGSKYSGLSAETLGVDALPAQTRLVGGRA
jgi:preprotein translocase subunit SecD